MHKELSDYNQLLQIANNNSAVILYFFSNNCAPCASLRPKIKELVETHFSEIKLVLIDAENTPEVSAKFGAFSFPTIIIFFEGKEYRRESKYISIPQLKESISRPYNMIFGE